MRESDIIIVGGGLVGSALASSIAQNNPELSIVILERNAQLPAYPEDQYDPRVVALNHRSVDFLKSLGAWDQEVFNRACGYTRMRVWDGEGNGSIHFSSDEVHLDQLGFIVENSLLLRQLRSTLNSCANTDLVSPAGIESVTLMDQACDSNIVVLDNGEKYSCSFLIAADGAESQLRKLAHIKTREWEYGQQAIVTTIKTEYPHRNTALQRFAHSGPLAFLPLAGGEQKYCSIVWSINEDFCDQKMSMSDQDFCSELTRQLEAELGEIVWTDKRFCINLRQRHALTYGRPGFALAGDAAHTIHPLAGQGVNLGLADAHALSGELTRAVERSIALSHRSIIERYQRSRKLQNMFTMALMEGFKRLFGVSSLPVLTMRNRGMSWINGQSALKRLIIKEASG